MRLRFDDRLEKYIFFFVIVWTLIIYSKMAIGIMPKGEINLGYIFYTFSYPLFFMIIPLIITYAIPWEEEKDIKFDLRETKITCIYFGVLFLWLELLAPELLLRGILSALSLLNIVASRDLVLALYRFGNLFPVFLFIIMRKQSLKTIGITTRNLGRSMLLMIIPFAYLLYWIFTSSISPASLMVLAFSALTVGIVEEFLYRGYPLFRLEPLPLGKGMAVLITGVIFAAVHGFAFLGFPFVLVPGLVYGLIFSKTRNILPLILLHMIWDLAILL